MHPALIGILAFVAVCFLLFGAWRMVTILFRWIRKRREISPAAKRNKMQEQQFLSKMLDDLRKNTDNWFITNDNGRSLLVNDKKAVAVVYSTGDTATILLNLEAISDFKKLQEDTVKIQISGKHVKDFLHTAEGIVDNRGRELAFFEEELEKRI